MINLPKLQHGKLSESNIVDIVNRCISAVEVLFSMKGDGRRISVDVSMAGVLFKGIEGPAGIGGSPPSYAGPFAVVDASDDNAQNITVLGYHEDEGRYFQNLLILGEHRQAYPETGLTLTTTAGMRIIVLELKETTGQSTYTLTLKDLEYTASTGSHTADTDSIVNYPLALVRFDDNKIAKITQIQYGWIIDLSRGF